MKKRLFVLLIVLCCLLCSVSYAGLKKTVPIKNVKFKTVDGQKFDLYQTLEEKDLVLINLWYLKCPGCIDELACMKRVYDEYKDRVEFVSINAYDSQKAVSEFCSTRELPWLFACNNDIATSWTQFYPATFVINKDHYILEFECLDTPSCVRYTLDTALGMTPDEYKVSAEEGLSFVAYRGKEKLQDFDSMKNLLRHYYNIKGDMSLTVECDGLRRIVVEDNLNMLQSNDKVGEFYIVSDNADHMTVTVHARKGLDVDKAHMFNKNDWSETPFRKAKKSKNDYTFELELVAGANLFSFYASDDSFASLTKDSYVGVCCFTSNEEAKKFFSNRARQYKCSIPWHVAEEGEIVEELPASGNT